MITNKHSLQPEIWLLPVEVDSVRNACWCDDKETAEGAQWAYKYIRADLVDDMLTEKDKQLAIYNQQLNMASAFDGV